MSIWIDFDGIYRNSDIWLNGQYLGNHQSGYTSFRWYIDQYTLNYGGGDNVLAVRVDVCITCFIYISYRTYQTCFLWFSDAYTYTNIIFDYNGTCSQLTMKDVCNKVSLHILHLFICHLNT